MSKARRGKPALLRLIARFFKVTPARVQILQQVNTQNEFPAIVTIVSDVPRPPKRAQPPEKGEGQWNQSPTPKHSIPPSKNHAAAPENHPKTPPPSEHERPNTPEPTEKPTRTEFA